MRNLLKKLAGTTRLELATSAVTGGLSLGGFSGIKDLHRHSEAFSGVEWAGEGRFCATVCATLAVLLLTAWAPAFGQTVEPFAPQPKWLDTQTKMELSASALAFAADGWTTRRNYVNATSFCNANNRVDCFTEYNPLLRPAVDSDVKVSAYFAGAFGAQIGANWLLRKHPRERHILNWAIIGTETFWASYNTYKRRF